MPLQGLKNNGLIKKQTEGKQNKTKSKKALIINVFCICFEMDVWVRFFFLLSNIATSVNNY